MLTDNVASLADIKAKKKGESGSAEAPLDPRPVITLREGEWRNRVADEAEAALIASGEPIYRQGPRAVRIIWDKIKVSGGGNGDVLRLSKASDAHILECFERAARFEKWDGRSESWVTANCPKDTAAAWLAREGDWKIPFLLGVITAPTIRPDGSVFDIPGYDEATGLVYEPAGWKFPSQIEQPTREDALAALTILKEPIAEFPFVNGANESVALSGMITAVIRRAMPSAPLHAFTAPTAGSGKSMLVDVAAIIATGERAAVTTVGNDKNAATELDKQLIGAMLAGNAVVSIDNLEGPLNSSVLCSVLTQTRVSLRKLGASDLVDVPITTSFFATSNNLIVGGDLTRRVLAGKLDPGVERPELRAFPFSPTTMAKARRGELVKAVLTIVRAWLMSGEKPSKTVLGSFEEWSNFVREPLIWLGCDDPVNVIEEVRLSDPRLARLGTVTEAWWAVFGEEEKTVAEVVAAAISKTEEYGPDSRWANPELREAFLAAASGGEHGGINNERLGWWLRKNAGRVVGDLHFERVDGYKSPKWKCVGRRGSGGLVARDGWNSDDIPF